MNTVWHYAPSTYIPRINESGELRTSNAGAPGEVPLLWFSANQKWEPTATKVVRTTDGRAVRLTFSQQAKEFGCVRFGLPADDVRMMDWKSACLMARTPRDARRSMEQLGKKLGADQRHWFGLAVNVPLGELVLQVWTSEWVAADSMGNAT